MNDVLREFFKEEIKANEEQAMNRGWKKGMEKGMEKGIEKGIEKGREEGRIETLYTDCNMSVSDIAKKVSKSEDYVKEIIKKISAACLWKCGNISKNRKMRIQNRKHQLKNEEKMDYLIPR